MLFTTVGVAFGTGCVLSSSGHAWAWTWFAALATLTVVRAAVSWSFPAPAEDHAAVERWQRNHALGLFASAALWMFPAFALVESHIGAQYTLAIIYSALGAGGTGIMAAMRLEGRIYIGLMMGPASVLLFLGAGQPTIMSAMGLAFMVVMMVVHRRNHIVVRRSVELQLENSALVNDLRTLNTELEAKVEQRTKALADAAATDALTGLPNRRGLMAWMGANLDGADERGAAVLFLDLDRFKQVNDAMGHDIGDQVLRMASQRLSQLVPPNAILARWGGDEFVLVIGHSADVRANAARIANTLVEAIAEPFDVGNQSANLGLSVGLSYYPDDAPDHRSLILAADLAVAEVKRNGRGQVFSYCESYAATQRRRFDLGRALGEAIAVEDIKLHYQPIVDARSGAIHAYEALARWRHPVLGQIDPEEFIRIAEDTDRIIALGDWVLRQACTDAAGWTTASKAPRVAVNVSVKQLVNEGFALRVAQILTQTGLAPGRLELEVTETVFVDEHLGATRAAVESLRAIGVSVLIDDFGTGYSSLSRLQSLPVSAVKIDRAFVSDIAGRGAVIIESTVMIARRLGIAVVAEGVEDAAQADALRAMGVDHLQGFYFGRPAANAERAGAAAPIVLAEQRTLRHG